MFRTARRWFGQQTSVSTFGDLDNVRSRAQPWLVWRKAAGRTQGGMRLLARLIIGGLCFAAIITASADEENKEITDALRRASDVVLKAHKASDLDAALIELHRLATVAVRFRSGNPERESAVYRLYDAARFLQQWQNYLWAVQSTDATEIAPGL
jgi:hypothetical protein